MNRIRGIGPSPSNGPSTRFATLLALLVITALLLTACPAATPAAPAEPAAAATAAPPPEAPAAEPEPDPTDTPAAEPEPAPTGAPAAEPEAQSRTFVIVPKETVAQYTIDEILIDRNNILNTAIGKTSQVRGDLTLNYADPTASQFGQFVVDISTLQSDSDRRDNAIRERWLESAKFPLATFDVIDVDNFPADPQEGQPIEFQLTGDMTIKETTRPQTWDVVAALDGDALTGTATTFLLLEDYGVPVPDMLNILKVTDGMTVTLNFAMQAQE